MEMWLRIVFILLGIGIFIGAFFVKDEERVAGFAQDKELAERINRKWVWTNRVAFFIGAAVLVVAGILCEDKKIAFYVMDGVVAALFVTHFIANKIFYGVFTTK